MSTAENAKRLLKFMYLQRVKGFETPAEPHFDEASTARFHEEIRKARSYLEFGSGGSTIVAGQLGLPTVTIESDRFFARAVGKGLPGGHKVELVPVNIGLTWEWGAPAIQKRTPRRLARWLRYVDTPFRIMRQFPDFILVDGRFRPACALEGARRARERGASAILMFDDYVERTHYHVVEELLGAPEIVGRAAFFSIGTQEVPRARVVELAGDPQ